MKKVISVGIIIFMVLSVIGMMLIPVIGAAGSDDESVARGSPRWSSYTAYYNKTFSISSGLDQENVYMAVLVQTEDTTSRPKDSQGSSGNFDSSEVMQSTIDFLDGSQKSTGTSRNVLGELFTATWCQYCPGGVGAFDRITRDSNFFPGKTTMIAFHASGDHGNPAGVTRSNLYNFGGIPTAIFDGYECFTGGNANPNSSTPESHYKRIINARASKQSIVDITTFGHKGNASGWINVSVELLNPTPLRNLKVQFMVVEDIYPANNTGAFYRYTVQQILTPAAFTPTNHAPSVKAQLQPITIPEDTSDSTSIMLGPAFKDEDLDVLTYSSDRDGSNKLHIKVEYDEDSNITLTPDKNWNGEEDITFYADDGSADPVPNVVTVTVENVNDNPFVNTPMVDFSTYEDVPVNDKFDLTLVFGDLDLDTDLNAVQQDPLEFTYSGDNHIDVTIEDDKVSFDPKPNWNGNETITITADDGAATVSDDVKIWVRSDNDPPVLVESLPKLTINEDVQKKDFLDLNEYFYDQDGDTLNYDYDDPENFKIQLNYKESSVFVTLTPDENYFGTETIIFKATDIPGSEPVTGNLEVTVTPVNDPPVLNQIADWDIISSSVIYAGTTIRVLEDNPITIYATANDLADNDKLTFTDDTELFNIDPNTGEISFTPTNDDVGIYEVEITVDDGQMKDNLDSDIFTFIVENVNDPPDTPKILSPTDGQEFIVNEKIELTATCTDPDEQITDSEEQLSYAWTNNKTNEVLTLGKTDTITLSPGFYTITLTVTDMAEETSTAETKIHVDIDRLKDTDSDGTPDYLDDDDDEDGMPDEWEKKYSSILNQEDPSDAARDDDKDGFTNLQEYLGDDGSVGGDDSTDPTRITSAPVVKESGDSSTSTTDFSMGLALVAIIVVIIVVILVVLIVIKKKQRGQDPSEPGTSTLPAQISGPGASSTQMPPQQPPYGFGPMPGSGFGPGPGQSQSQQLQQQPQSQYPNPYQAYPGVPDPLYQSNLPMSPETTVSGLPPSPSSIGNPMLPSPSDPNQDSLEHISEDNNESTSASNGSACSKCGTIIKGGWVICPNCKSLQ